MTGFYVFLYVVGGFAFVGLLIGSVSAWIIHDVETDDSLSPSDVFMAIAVKEHNRLMAEIAPERPPIVYPKPRKSNAEIFDEMKREFFGVVGFCLGIGVFFGSVMWVAFLFE